MTFVKSLLRKIKRSIRKLLIKALGALDSDSLVTFEQKSFLFSTPAGLSINENLSEINNIAVIKPILFNQNQVILDETTLKLQFDSFVDIEKNKKDELWNVVVANKAQLLDVESLYNFLINLSAKDESLDKLQANLINIRRETIENSQVYLYNSKKEFYQKYWPDPTLKTNPSTLFEARPFVKSYNFIDKDTKVGSAGSCFAMEIAHYLLKKNFNYMVTEEEPGKQLPISSARWGIIFNTPSFTQLIKRSFGVKNTPPILWSNQRGDHTFFYDPFREDIVFSSVQDYVSTYKSHLEACRKVLSDCDVFIITLGLNEVWRLRADHSYFSRAPWKISPSITERKVLTVEENVKELQEMFDLWKIFNRNLKLIVTVSPVPLHATFSADKKHVIEANCYSKSSLRCAAEEFSNKNEDVYYFPAYETVMYTVENAWEPDLRHVSRSAVSKVMSVFEDMFVKS